MVECVRRLAIDRLRVPPAGTETSGGVLGCSIPPYMMYVRQGGQIAPSLALQVVHHDHTYHSGC